MKMNRACLVILSLCFMAMPAMGANLVISPPGSLSIGVGQETQLAIGISGATDGISGFHINLEVTDTDVLDVADVAFDDWVMLEEFVSPGADLGYIRGIDLSQMAEPGEGSFQFAVLSLAGVTNGMATITITPHILEDDFGDLYKASAMVIPVTVGVVTPPSSGGSGGGGSFTSTPTSTPTPTATATATPAPEVTPIPTTPVTAEEAEEPAPEPVITLSTDSDQMGDEVTPTDEPDIPKSSAGLLLPILASLLALMLIGSLRGRDPEN